MIIDCAVYTDGVRNGTKLTVIKPLVISDCRDRSRGSAYECHRETNSPMRCRHSDSKASTPTKP